MECLGLGFEVLGSKGVGSSEYRRFEVSIQGLRFGVQRLGFRV